MRRVLLLVVGVVAVGVGGVPGVSADAAAAAAGEKASLRASVRSAMGHGQDQADAAADGGVVLPGEALPVCEVPTTEFSPAFCKEVLTPDLRNPTQTVTTVGCACPAVMVCGDIVVRELSVKKYGCVYAVGGLIA